MSDHVCLSGGAIGADTEWSRAAKQHGHEVVHFSFVGHQLRHPPSEVIKLTTEQLSRANDPCVAAARFLRKKFNPGSQHFVANLLRRNWYQVRDAESCYAIAPIKDGLVDGGTGWAVAMYLARYKMAACPLYVFEPNECHWFEWTGTWTPIYQPPEPTGVWAGIGTRKLNIVGILAIGALLDYWPHRKTIWTKPA